MQILLLTFSCRSGNVEGNDPDITLYATALAVERGVDSDDLYRMACETGIGTTVSVSGPDEPTFIHCESISREPHGRNRNETEYMFD